MHKHVDSLYTSTHQALHCCIVLLANILAMATTWQWCLCILSWFITSSTACRACRTPAGQAAAAAVVCTPCQASHSLWSRLTTWEPCALSGKPSPAVGLSCNCSPSFCTSAGLVSSLGASTIPSILQAALQASQQQVSIPPTLLHQAHSIDQQALQLLTQRGQGILAGLAGLQAYSAALRLVLGHAYADSSHHSQSAGAIKSGIAANDTEVSYLTSAAVCLHTLYVCIGACTSQAVS